MRLPRHPPRTLRLTLSLGPCCLLNSSLLIRRFSQIARLTYRILFALNRPARQVPRSHSHASRSRGGDGASASPVCCPLLERNTHRPATWRKRGGQKKDHG